MMQLGVVHSTEVARYALNIVPKVNKALGQWKSMERDLATTKALLEKVRFVIDGPDIYFGQD